MPQPGYPYSSGGAPYPPGKLKCYLHKNTGIN